MLKKYWSLLRASYRIQQLARYLRPLTKARPRWKKIIKTKDFSGDQNSKRILIATSTGSHWAMSGFESIIAAALKLRGAKVEVLLCDGLLPACQECDLRLIPEKVLLKKKTESLCKSCFKPAEAMFSELMMTVHQYGKYVSTIDRAVINKILSQIEDDELSNFVWKNIPVGEHALAGALRFYGRGDLNGEPKGIRIVRQYLHAALLATVALENLFSEHHFDTVVFHHGIYIPQGIVGEVCRKRNINVVNWHPAYRIGTYLFSHGDTYHKTMISEHCSVWENMDWDEKKEQSIMKYLTTRRTGSQDWISFQHADQSNNVHLSISGLDFERPIIGLLTNVIWDAQLHFRQNAFQSILEWLWFSIEYFMKRPDLQLLIRIHPAELLGGVPSRQCVEDEIRLHFPTLTPNIFIVGSNSTLNTYELMEKCNAVLVYGTKMSIELPCFGKPTIVAGEAWARGKGFTIDVSSKEQYGEVLNNLPLKTSIDEQMVRRARQYAYYFFYKRMIPVKFAKRSRRLVPFAYEVPSLNILKLGVDAGLDLICDGILTGKAFVFDDM